MLSIPKFRTEINLEPAGVIDATAAVHRRNRRRLAVFIAVFLFTLVPGSVGQRPKITAVDPPKGSRDSFPVRIMGENLGGSVDSVKVTFGITVMPVQEVAPDGSYIVVAFPGGGLPEPGKMDVKVSNLAKSADDVLINGFEYVNDTKRRKFFGLFACSPGAGGNGADWGDALWLMATLAALAAARRGKRVKN